MEKAIALFVVSIENLKTLKYHTFLKKDLSLFYYLPWVWRNMYEMRNDFVEEIEQNELMSKTKKIFYGSIY